MVEPERSRLLGRLPGLLSEFAPSQPVTVEEMRKAVALRARRLHSEGSKP